MGAQVYVPITPPNRETRGARLSPESYLQDDEFKPTLARKCLTDRDSSESKRIKLFPSPKKGDITILHYHDRVSAIGSHNDKIMVNVPLQMVLDEVNNTETTKQHDTLKEKIDMLTKQNRQNTLEIETLKEEINVLKNQHEQDRMKIDALEEQIVELKTQLEQARIENMELKTHLERARIENMELKTQLEQARIENMELKTHLERARIENMELKTHLEQARIENMELKTQLEQARIEIAELKTQIEQARTENVSLNMKMDDLNDEVARHRKERKEREEELIFAYGMNLLTKCLNRIGNKNVSSSAEGSGNSTTHSTTRCIRIARDLNDKTFVKATSLPLKCFEQIKKYPDFIERRNKWAHDTDEQFAKLLIKEEHQFLRYTWAPWLEYLRDESVEALAEKAKTAFEDFYGL